jgi:hypothetical protein
MTATTTEADAEILTTFSHFTPHALRSVALLLRRARFATW